MPARHTFRVALTEPLVSYIRAQVAAGRHANASEAVRCALELLIEREATAGGRAPASPVESSARGHG